MATISLRALSHRHGAAPTPALDGVDLDLEPGLTLLAGASGSGKSTLLRVFNGLVPHFHGGRMAGTATVCGLDVTTTSTARLARHVGMVFQDPEAQLIGGTVEREVAFGPANLGLPRTCIGERVDSALARSGTEGLRHRAVATLSGGERQRVAVAAALAMAPEVLALDEPTAQLDRQGGAAVLEVCLAEARRGTTVVVAEHRLERLLPAANRVAVLDGGGLLGMGSPQDMAARLAAAPQVVRLGRRAGWRPLPLETAAVAGRLHRRQLPTRAAPTAATSWQIDRAVIGHGPIPLLEVGGLEGGAGEVVVLVGPNGGGKTTLLRALAGLHPLLAGSVHRPPGRTALLPQNPTAVLHRTTVAEEIRLTLGHDAGRDAATVLRALGLEGLAASHPRDLSTGQRQRVAVAAMLCGRPALALLDEPTRGMDADARAGLVIFLSTMAASGTAVVLATHDAELAAAVATRVVEVGHGAVRELGPPRTALTAPSPYATQLGELWTGGPVTVTEALSLCR